MYPPYTRVAQGALLVRERRADVLTLWLSGWLDEATSVLLDRELDDQTDGSIQVVVDLTGLEFIDPIGLDTLVRSRRRASVAIQHPSSSAR